MRKELLLVGIMGLVAGVGIAWAVTILVVNNNNTNMMKVMGIHTDVSNTSDMSMNQMMEGLKGKTGDDFDKNFIIEMIVHHQGAIDMANLARTNAKHDEVKKMANDIVNTQTKEINEMRGWQNQWGYRNPSSTNDMMDMGH